MKYKFLVLVLGAILILSLILVESLDLNVTNPKNNTNYNSTWVEIQLSSSNKSIFYYADMNDSGNWIRLCPKIDFICIKRIKVKEGYNLITFKAVNSLGESNNVNQTSFMIDSRKPEILKTSLLKNAQTNGSLLSIRYNEDNTTSGKGNMDNITLFYGTDEDIRSFSKTNCPTGINQNCKFNDINNISEFDGKNIQYWFSIFDGANTILSKKTKIKIDTTSPLVSIVSTIINGGKVKFILDVTEDNFDEIIYRDTNQCKLEHISSRLLCKKLHVGRCVVTKNFCIGEHNLKIIVKDKAGNSVTKETSFTIES